MPKKHLYQVQHGGADNLLCALAIKLDAFDPDDPRARPTENRLIGSIRKRLLAGEDNALAAAVDHLLDTGSPDAGELLLQLIENAATTYTSVNGKFAAHLFAAPILLITELMGDQTSKDAAQAYSDLSDSFQRAGLLQPGASVRLATHLYSPEELARLRWSAAANLARSIGAASTGSPVLRDHLFQDEEQPVDSEVDPLFVRYLVGVHISKPGQWMYFHSAEDAADEQQHERRIEDWLRIAGPVIQRISAGAKDRSVHRPHDLFAALRAGLASGNDLMAGFFVFDDIRRGNAAPADVLAEVARGTHDGKRPAFLRISLRLRGNRSPLGEILTPLAPFETTETAMQRLGAALVRLGIGEVRLIGQADSSPSAAPGINIRLLH